MKIQTNDNVIIIAGKDKGKTGIVQKVYPKLNRVVVAGVNIHIKTTKPTQQKPEGGKVEVYAPLHVSNVMIVDPKTKKRTRVGHSVVNDEKVRITKASKTPLENYYYKKGAK
jgi:large subunit ribosomal protein L24